MDKYFKEMDIPPENACYVKCRYSHFGNTDYFVKLNDPNKGFAFVDTGLIKRIRNELKDNEGLKKGFVRANALGIDKNLFVVRINGEGFGVPKKDVVFAGET